MSLSFSSIILKKGSICKIKANLFKIFFAKEWMVEKFNLRSIFSSSIFSSSDNLSYSLSNISLINLSFNSIAAFSEKVIPMILFKNL